MNNKTLQQHASQINTQMRKGTLSFYVLHLLQQKPMYVADIIAKLSAAEMIVVEGTLYPLLTRLKNQSLLKYEWEESESGPPRKYYSLTNDGKEILGLLDKQWADLNKTINAIKKPAKQAKKGAKK